MDLQGSLIDTCLRLYPSDKLISFLRKQKLCDNVPINISKIAGDVNYKTKSNKAIDPKPVDFYLNNREVEMLSKIKDKLKEDKVTDSKIGKENETSLTDDDEMVKIKDIKNNSEEYDHGLYLSTSDIDWLYVYIKKSKDSGADVPYLHELIEGSHIELPKNEVLKRNPVLEARCVKLRAQQEAREYRKMTKGVDNVRMKFPEDSISYQLKQVNRQLIAIGQFILSIFAGFLFGFKGVEWMVGYLDFGFRLLLGVMCALVIALAEIYFLAKKLNEELNVPETTQLGGPVKFVDERLNENRLKSSSKPHQD